MESLKVKKNSFGYFEIVEKPGASELAEFYEKKYYQQQKGGYSANYSKDEIEYIENKIRQRYHELQNLTDMSKPGKLLELGAGEGFTLRFFRKKGWEVKGLDFSDYGCRQQNPECLEYLITGDIYQNLDRLIQERDTSWDIIWLDNLLEHVLDPEDLLKTLRRLISDAGMLVIEVPNDFSPIQEYLLDNGFIDRQYWVSPPDHLSYFSFEGLANLCNEVGFQVKSALGDHPIELNLLQSETNYIAKPDVGKGCHRARILTDSFMSQYPVDLVIDYYKVLAKMEIGRTLTVFASIH